MTDADTVEEAYEKVKGKGRKGGKGGERRGG